MTIWTVVKDRRYGLLTASDWTQSADSPLSDTKKAEWATYRQKLRDLPETYKGETDLLKIVFPTPPE
jgi:DNA-binding transcriptional regulator/RsmH inhibitor MraZ|tara:strand:- start:165 stop:365 length:201 start_codon:yes stop_codon:yes gene_type:complete